MTHFVGIVIHSEEESIDDLLAPFDEEREMPRYMVATRAQVIEKERARVAAYAAPDGPYGRFLADPADYVEGMIFGGATSAPRFNHGHLNYIVKGFPLELSWSDEQLHEHGIQFEDDVDEDGNVWSTRNPDSIWDWWVIGGRWSDEYVAGNRTSVADFRSLVEANGFERALPRVLFDRSGALRRGIEGWWGFMKDDVDEPTWRSQVLDRLEPHTEGELVTFIDLHI